MTAVGEVAPEAVTYLASSKHGFGHVSRAVAIASEMGGRVPFTIAANYRSHRFLTENFAPESSCPDLVDLDYYPMVAEDEFAALNAPVLDRITTSSVVVNDFLTQVPLVRSFLDRQGLEQSLIGVYHSIDGYPSETLEIKRFQDLYKRIAGCLDYLFLTEPKSVHRAPYQLDSGTTIVPCDPVARQVTVSPEEVKSDIGLQPDDNFIYVQGGMGGSAELADFVRAINSLSLHGLKFVIAPLKQLSNILPTGNGVMYMQSARYDAQNLINASIGVISKPGMSTVCESIASRKPLLLVGMGDQSPEAHLKYTMLSEILEPDGLPYGLNQDASIAEQLDAWLAAGSAIRQAFSLIPCKGASLIADYITDATCCVLDFPHIEKAVDA